MAFEQTGAARGEVGQPPNTVTTEFAQVISPSLPLPPPVSDVQYTYSLWVVGGCALFGG